VSFPAWIWIPPAVHISLGWFFNTNLLPRHVLPVSIFLILAAARAFSWLQEELGRHSSTWIRSLPFLLLAWHALSVAAQWPHAVSYANEALPRALRPVLLKKLTWQLDQDVKRLAEEGLRRKWERVKLVSTGRTDPFFYGLSWEPWTVSDLERPETGTVYVVDAALFQVPPEDCVGFPWKNSWLTRATPTGNLGGTWDYYEFPGAARTTTPSPYLPSFLYADNGYPFYRKNFKPGNMSSGRTH